MVNLYCSRVVKRQVVEPMEIVPLCWCCDNIVFMWEIAFDISKDCVMNVYSLACECVFLSVSGMSCKIVAMYCSLNWSSPKD